MYKTMVKIAFLFILLFNLSHADKLQTIQNSGIINAGVKYDFEPFGYLDTNNNLVGFEIDLINYIASKLNVTAKFHQVTSKNRIEKLQKGDVDILAASMTHKIQRDKLIDFSISYFFDGQAFLVRKNSKKRSAEGFNGKYVGAVKGSTSGINLRKVAPKAQITYYQNYTKALDALKAGMIDAITTDLVWCTTQAKNSQGKLRVIKDIISFEPYGMGIPENESNFRDAVNFAIADAVKDGTYTKLYRKWFAQDPKRLPVVWPN